MTIREAPRWFIQTEDGALHSYWTLGILLCDLTLHRGEPVRILEARRGPLLAYELVTEGELRERARMRA